MPRRAWNKILTTQVIKDLYTDEQGQPVNRKELYELLMLYPDREYRNEDGDVKAFCKKADDALTVELPRLQHICEPKAQMTEDGVPTFLVMAEHKRTVEKSFNVRSLNKESIADKKKKKKGKGGEEGRQEKKTISLQTLYCPGNNLEFAVKQDIEEEVLENDINPIPFNSWVTPG